MKRYLSAILALTLSITSASGTAWAATATWTFDDGSDYSFSGSLIEVTGGNAQLLEAESADLYESGWTKRAPVTIDNSGNLSTLTNYQVQVDLTYDADMQTDFDDIRFTNEDDILLDHWLETKTDSDSATFWVEADSIPASGTGTVYVNYGSGSAASTSNGEDTFLLFDDFSTGTTQGILTASGEQLLFQGTGSGDWLARPVFLDDGDKWILVYRQGGLHGYDEDGVIHIRFSENEGATWTDINTFTDASSVTGAPFIGHGATGVGDPILIPAPNGDLLLHIGETNISNRVSGSYQYRSTDGGATWTDEGLINDDTEIYSGQDYAIVGNDVYATFWKDENSDGQPYHGLLYKTSNNGETWTLVSNTTTTADNTDESGIEYVGNDTFVVVSREPTSNTTYQLVSTDLGQTWGELTDISSAVGVMQRPRMRIYPDEPDRLYLFGRYHVPEERTTVVFYSDDDGTTWSEPFFPDASTFNDAGYTDMLKRSDGSFYMLSYAGTHSAADIIEYTFGFEDALRPDPEKWESRNALATISGSHVIYQELNTKFEELGVLQSTTSLTRPFIAEMDMNVLSFDHSYFQFGPDPAPFAATRDSYVWEIDIDHPADDLVAYWKFDETVSGTFADASGNDNSGTGLGTAGTNSTPQPTVDSAPLAFTNDRALNFDGTDDTVSTSVSTVAGPKTVSLWFKTDTVASGTRSFFHANCCALEFGHSGANTILRAAGTADKSWSFTNTTGTGTLVADTWYHMAIYSDGTGIYWYLNGELDGSDTSYTGNLNAFNNITIGARDGGPYTDGNLDDIRIYNRALTESEIEALAAGCEGEDEICLPTSDPKQDLTRHKNGTIHDIQRNVDVSPDIANDEQFNQQFVFTGTGIIVSTNDTEYIAATEATHASGYIGIAAGADSIGSTDMIKVRAYTAIEPTISVGSEEPVASDTASYPVSSPAIAPTAANAQTFDTLSAFSATENAGSGSILYQVSNDSGSTWYWYDSGWTATASDESEANTGSVINTNIGTLPVGDGEFLFKAYLNSDGTQLVQLSDVSLTYESSVASSSSSSSSAGTSGGGGGSGGGGSSGGGGGSGGGGRGSSRVSPTALPGITSPAENPCRTDQASAAYRIRSVAFANATPSAWFAVNEQPDSDEIVPCPFKELYEATDDARFLLMEVAGRLTVFHDVPLDAWFASYIRDIIQQGIASGYENTVGDPLGLFMPQNPVTYGELAKMALQSAGRAADPSVSPRNSLARNHWSSSYIAAAEETGLSIYTDSLNPDAPATRGEVIRTLLEAHGITLHKNPANPFKDLSSSHPHAQHILTATNLGILSGDTDIRGSSLGTVRPDATINRAEVAKMIVLTGRE